MGRPRTIPFGPKPRPQKRGRKSKTPTAVTIVAAPRKAPSFGPTGGFPKKKKVTLKYVQDFLLTQSTSSFNVIQSFRTNSIYNPSYASGGHQPYMHDQFAQIYNHYQVMKARCVVTAVSPQGSTLLTGSPIIGIQQSANIADVPTDKNLIREIGKGYKQLTAQRPIRVSSTWSAKGNFPSTSPGQDALFGANPAEDYFFNVYALVPDAQVATNIACTVTITYYVMLWELRNVGSS